MRVPGVRSFPFKKWNHMPQRLKIFQDLSAAVAVENHQRYSPKTLPRNAPVGPVLDHVVDAPFSPSRNPLHFLYFFQRRAAQPRCVRRPYRRAAVVELDEPLFRSAENNGLVAAPAMRIAVREFLLCHQHLTVFQQRNNCWIRFENSLAFIRRQPLHKSSVVIQRSIRLQTVFLPGREVFGSMTWSGMHASAALLQRHIVRQHTRYDQFFKERMPKFHSL